MVREHWSGKRARACVLKEGGCGGGLVVRLVGVDALGCPCPPPARVTSFQNKLAYHATNMGATASPLEKSTLRTSKLAPFSVPSSTFPPLILTLLTAVLGVF